ncbi:phage holin family protein [Patescibacteria group bacterium]|nr:phage holin family protein [Patescibacteria group bacterium]
MIKKILRYTLLFSFSLITVNYYLNNLIFDRKVETIVLVALILAIFEIFIKPIVQLLLLPITIITLGTIRIIINTIGLYLATFLLTDFNVQTIDTPSFTLQGFVVPKFHFEGIIAYIVTSFAINLCYNIFNIISKRKVSR